MQGYAEASSVLEQGGLRDDCGGSVAAGGLSGWRADGAQRRTGWRDEGVRGWWLWRVADGLLRGSCGTAAVGWPVVEAVGCRPGRRLRGLAAGVVASGKGCFGGRNAWGLPVLLRYGAADGCGGVDRKAGFLSPGRAIEMESRKGGRNEGVREWTWRLSGADSGDSSVDGLRSVPGQGDSGVVRPFAARYDRFFLLGGRPFAAVSPFIGSGPLQRCWQAFLGLNNPLPRCGAGFSRTGGDVLWRGPRYRSAAVSCAQR